jgi:molybdopterin/thiamine biosynthesis adenylyltransferase
VETERLDIDSEDDRFSRLKLISWWDQNRLSEAKVLLIGVGALGNEILKNLALVGVKHVFVADLDRVENSNLSRSVLFRVSDCGRSKADVAAEAARRIYPEMRVQAFVGNIVYELGLGVYRWADIVIGGLDNREARVAINQAAARTGRVWIDGAIERLDGVARVFDPAVGPCYECTMNETDWKMLEARRSCALLSRDEMERGKVPTTPTTASIIAGIQTQEAVKYLHGLEVIAGQGFVFEGTRHQSYTVTYTRNPDCPAHEPYEPIQSMNASAADLTVRELLKLGAAALGGDAVLEFNQDLVVALRCDACRREQQVFAALSKVTEAAGRCPGCGAMRQPILTHSADGTEPFADRTLAEVGVPPWDILGVRRGTEYRYIELAGDRRDVLGVLGS